MRLQQFEEMEHQRLGIPLSGQDLLMEIQDAHDWNVIERILWDQKRWEREEEKRKDAVKAIATQDTQQADSSGPSAMSVKGRPVRNTTTFFVSVRIVFKLLPSCHSNRPI
jgi:hypothetical protein